MNGSGRVEIKGANIGSALQDFLRAGDIVLGSQPGYQLCKTIYLYHPLGGKIVEKPLELAQSQKRKISIPDSPEQVVVEAFEKEWKALRADAHIFNVMKQSRIYGIAAIALLEDERPTEDPVDFERLYKARITFNVYDPLNVAGSLVTSQDPLAMDFQHVGTIAVSGRGFHRSRACIMMNEQPIYLDYQSSTFGFTGRSVYQRALFPLKTFINTMIADDMAARKVGLIVAYIKHAGSIMDNIMASVTAFKRVILQQGETDQVLSAGEEDRIESLNLQNLDAPLTVARRDCLENIASSVPMPAKLITQETLAEGFGEGTEDAKQIAQFIDRIREAMDPVYAWFDKIVRYRAWNPDFYQTIQKRFPEQYGSMDYKEAFYRWTNSMATEWPSLIKEPDSELVKVDDVKLRAVVALLEVFLPILDPVNKLIAIQWAADAFNELKLLFGSPLNFDFDSLDEYLEEQQAQAEEQRKHMLEGGMGDGGEKEDGGEKTPNLRSFTQRGDSRGSVHALGEFRRSLDALVQKKTKGGV